jgi:alpha-1,3-fucosyltransferase
MAIIVASNCNPKSQRNLLVDKLSSFIDVDRYGKCGNLTCDLKTMDCTNLERSYRFYLSFENSICEDYVTEKVFKVMQQIVIPVVYNGANMTRFLPPKSVSLRTMQVKSPTELLSFQFINVDDFKTVEDLAKYLKFLSRNPDEYVKYFWWRKHYEVLGKNNMWCDICRGVNEVQQNSRKSVINEFFDPKTCYKAKIEDNL